MEELIFRGKVTTLRLYTSMYVHVHMDTNKTECVSLSKQNNDRLDLPARALISVETQRTPLALYNYTLF